MHTKEKAMLTIAVLLLFVVFAPASHAAIFTVNSTLDAGDAANVTACQTNAAGCTLRAAVLAANAAADADTIILPAETFILTGEAGEDAAASGDLDIGVNIASTLTITGQGQALTIIDGGGTDRLFETITNGTSLTVSLVTIRNGNSGALAGGCILAGANTSLALNNAIVTGCTAVNGGGGIDNSGSLTMNVVALTNNTAQGINNGAAGTITWTDGELTGATDRGINNSGTLSLTNVTVSGNTTAGNGGGIDNGGTVTLQNVTIANNTSSNPLNIGGLRNDGTASLRNTIISGNSPANCGGAAALTSLGNNIDNGNTCGFGGAGDLPNTDPLLVALANNGGSLRTHALQPTSPAIDAGSATGCPATDARGITRPVDGNPVPPAVTAICDIGAFEFRPRKVAVDPASPFNFGTVTSGTNVDQTLTIANGGDADLIMGTIAAADALAAPFTMPVNNCNGVTLARAASCTLTVRFSPASTTPATDTFSIPSNDPLTPTVTFSVSGTGTANLVSNIAVTDSIAPANDLALPFGGVAVGGTSDATITIASSGDAALTIGTIAVANPLAAPFSITSDTCSNQAIAPTQSCTLTVRFAPTTNAASSDTFDIPNNDPDTPTITIAVSGSGVSAAGNNPPSTPVLVSPANGATGLGTTVTFSWNRSTDPDGDAVTHRFFNCPDQTFTAAGCGPVDVAAAPSSGLTFAGLGSLGAGVIVLGLVAGTGFRRSRKAMLIVVTLLLMGVSFVACNGDDGGGVPAEMTHTVTGLTPGTTYFWKVVADDGRGGQTSSEIRSFTTQ